MKKKTFMLFSVLAFGFLVNIMPTNAQSLFDAKTLESNNKQAKITSEIEEIMKKESYPDYYGGSYISDDSSHVILQVVEKNVPKTRSSNEYSIFNKMKSMDSNITIEYVKNSYKELNDINDKLIEYFSSPNADVSNLSSHYVDVFNNVVVVELLDNTSIQASNLKTNVLGGNTFKSRALDSDIIVFSKGEQQRNHANINVGQQINTCSMGYRVRIGGANGYITAGHCFSGTGQSAYGGTVKRYKESGKVDAAFVQTTSSYTPTNNLHYTSGSITKLDNTLCPFLQVNQVIAKAGYKTGYTSGRIKNLNYSGTYDGIYFTGLIAADYSTSGGDSGGAVFVPSNTSSGGAPLAGINKGTSSYGSAFVNANEIYSAFGYSRY